MTDKWDEDDRLDARDADGAERYDYVENDNEEWYEVSRRYRRGLGGWWWLALLAIPLLLALLGTLFGGDDKESEGDKSSTSSSSSDGASSQESDSTEGAVSADSVSYTATKDEVSFKAAAASEADRDALVKAVEDANEGRTVNADVAVDDKAPVIEKAGLAALTAALTAGGENLSVSGDASALTLTGEVADAAAKKKVASEFAKVYPDATITNDLTVAGAADPSETAAPSSSAPESTSPESSETAAPSSSAPESATAEPSETAAPSPKPTAEPSETAAPSPKPTQSPKPTAEPSPKPTADPVPVAVADIQALTCDNAKASMNKVNSRNPIRFPSSSDALYGDSALNAGRIGQKLAGCDFDVVVVGHTDNVGGKVNDRLSGLRAEKVAQALVVAGVDFNRIEKSNMSAKQPIASNKSEDGRSKNRRVEILVK